MRADFSGRFDPIPDCQTEFSRALRNLRREQVFESAEGLGRQARHHQARVPLDSLQLFQLCYT